MDKPKNVKKIIKTKANGLITTKIKILNPKAAFSFSVSAKVGKGKSIDSQPVEYSPISYLLEIISNLPAGWGNPKPIQLPAPAPTIAQIAVPAFTLSSATESRTVNTAATGFTVNSTGGAIASFSINATPSGMSFNATTGALTGTPNTVAAATNYTITAINVTGTAAQTFTLTVTAIVYAVGNLGPAGGRIIYVSADGFSCGPTRGGDGIPTATCKYLEAAPSGWFSGVVGGLDPRRPWAQSAPINYQMATVGETPRNIGYGLSNTLRIINQGNNNPDTSAAALANSYTVTVDGVTYNDWALPSRDELNQMCRWQRGNTVSNDRCAGGILNSGTGASGFPSTADGVVTYWSSTEATTFVGGAVGQDCASNDVGFDNNRCQSYNDHGIIRPVRAFQ
jgi:hypothetical protein